MDYKIDPWAHHMLFAGAFTFSVPAEAGYGVEADPNPPRLMGAPFAVDLHAGHCYAILPGGQVRTHLISLTACPLCPFWGFCTTLKGRQPCALR